MSTTRARNSAKGLRAFAPYILVELFLPGGTLVALLLWLSQRLRQGRMTRTAPAAGPAHIATGAVAPFATPAPAADA
jgi:hypothetical protein